MHCQAAPAAAASSADTTIVARVIAIAIGAFGSWQIGFGFVQVTAEDAASVCFGGSAGFGLESEGIPEPAAEA